MQTDLPIWTLRDALRETWASQNTVTLVAPTGSGKTTQVCQMLLAERPSLTGRIVVLQPRRVAARSVARRVAEEMNVPVGGLVGYQVRFEDVTELGTRICFVTEGILLRWLRDNPDLRGVDAVLFDEFHERNLLSDIALALCKRIQRGRRPELLLMVMSATLEAAPVAAYLGQGAPSPILESRGREFPVELKYETWDEGNDLELPVWGRAAWRCARILDETPEGDILVFMPGAYEIEQTIGALRAALRGRTAPTQLLALHGELPPREQDRVFATSEHRRVIVATNVAETSLTIPGIRAVVDSGLARVARFDAGRGIGTLALEEISQASADQRAGRAGRVGPGVCYRLWPEKIHARRPARNTPEVQRVELSDVALQLAAQGVTDIEGFDFLDRPDAGRIHAAIELLRALGALTGEPRDAAITAVGRQMLRLPAHPRYARMMVEAQRYGCERDAALFAALMSGRELLVRVGRQETITRKNRARVIEKSGENQSDFFALKRAFEFAVAQHFEPKACYTHGINPHVAREVAMTFEQLERMASDAGSLNVEAQLNPVPDNPASDSIRRCHLAGFVDQLATRQPGATTAQLAGGHEGELAEESVAARGSGHRLYVVSEIRAITTRTGEKLTLLNTVSAVEAAWVRALRPPPAGLSETIEHVYDRLSKRVVAGRILRYRDLMLGGEPHDEIDPAQAAQALAREFVDKLEKLPRWNNDVRPWLAKHRALAEMITVDMLQHALAAAWLGATTYKDILELPILPGVQAALGVE